MPTVIQLTTRKTSLRPCKRTYTFQLHVYILRITHYMQSVFYERVGSKLLTRSLIVLRLVSTLSTTYAKAAANSFKVFLL